MIFLEMIYCCIWDVGLLLLFGNCFERKDNFRRNVVIFWSAMYTMTAIMHFTNVESLVFRAVLGFITMGFALHFLYKIDSLKKLIIQDIIFTVCLWAAELSLTFMFMILAQINDVGEMMSNMLFWFVSYTSSKCMETVFIGLVRKIGKNIKGKKLYLMTTVMSLVFIYLVFVFYCFRTENLSHEVVSLMFVVNMVFIVIIFLGYFVYLNFVGRVKLQEKELELMYEKVAIQVESYEELALYKQELKKLHDEIEKNILASESLKGDSVEEKCLESVRDYLQKTYSEINTGNEILDLILLKKMEECREKAINLQINVDFKKGGFINLVDIGVIFGNIIDNAIEASQNNPKGKKDIWLYSDNSENSITIIIENYADVISEQKGRLVTMKRDRKNHGIGLCSLEEALAKYNGF